MNPGGSSRAPQCVSRSVSTSLRPVVLIRPVGSGSSNSGVRLGEGGGVDRPVEPVFGGEDSLTRLMDNRSLI